MARYVSMNHNDRLMLRNLVNGIATYHDKVRAVNLIDAYDNADEYDPVAEWRDQQIAHLFKLEGTTGSDGQPTAPQTEQDPNRSWRAASLDCRGREADFPPATARDPFLCHCGRSADRVQQPDPFEGRLDGYCDECAWNRCDCYPDECPVKYPGTGAAVSFSDPGDGYDSAIRWHADFERGDI